MTLPVADPVLIFAIVMSIILLAPFAVKKIRLPSIVGIILAGAIVGPSGLGILERDQTIELLGTVGLLYLMYTAGISINLTQFAKYKTRSITFGTISFSLPLILALFIFTVFFEYSFSTALLIGSIVGTHTLLAYPIAQRLGISGNRAATMTVGGSIIADSLGLTILAVVTASASGEGGISFWLTFIGVVMMYLAGVFLWLQRIAKWFFRYPHEQTHTEFVFLLALFFVVAYLAKLAGLAPIIGAFLAGLLTNRLIPDNSVLMNRMLFVGDALFIPFFLISVGMLVDFSVVVSSVEIWKTAILFIGIVVAGKLIASKFVATIYKFTAAESLLSFGLSVPQAAATLAVTLVAYDIGLFGIVEVNGVLIMILVTCIIGPIFVEKYGRIVALEETKASFAQSSETPRIMVPLSNPESIRGLMDLALLMQDKNSEQPIFPITVVAESGDVQSKVAASEKMLSQALNYAAQANVAANPMTRVDLCIATGLKRAVTERLISTIVIGWNGETSTEARIFGSVLDQLLASTKQMVAVCKIDTPINTCHRVVVTIPPYADREDGYLSAITTIAKITKRLSAPLHIIALEKDISQIEAALKKIKSELKIDSTTLKNFSSASSSIISVAKDDDLIVVISARRGSLSWQPLLDYLPGKIANNLPKNNFVILYPSEDFKS